MRIVSWGLLIATLVLSNMSAFAASKSELYGNWKAVSGPPIQLHLKRDMHYVYTYKMLTFMGKWSISGNELTLTYTVLGRPRKKESSVSLKNGFMTMRSNEYSTVVLKKSR